VKTIAFVHQAGAGEQLTEAMIRAVLGDALRVCEYRLDPGCCNANPCRRWSEFDRAGYQLFVLKSAGGESLLSLKAGEPTLVQIREPVLRALANYARDLRRSGRRHSVEILQSWLSAEAIAVVDFHRTWMADAPRRDLLRFEDLLRRPRESADAILSAAGVPVDDTALERAVQESERWSDRGADVSIRGLEADPNFVRPLFAEFMNLLADEADYLGYPAWTDRKPASGPVTALYRARRARLEGNFEAVLSILTPFVAVNAAEPEIRAMLGEALLETGREAEGRRALEIVFKARPDFFDAHAILARHAYRLGLTTEGRAILREASSRRGGAGWARAFLEKTAVDGDLLAEIPGHAEPPLGREAVVAGFTWILGREPENDVVIEAHRGLHDDDDLRLSLLRSQEFREFHERFEAGAEQPSGPGEPVRRDDVLLALRWILGRPLRARDEADSLLAASSRAELRLKLLGEDEFRQAYGHVAEAV
jgi:hypothetical protein